MIVIWIGMLLAFLAVIALLVFGALKLLRKLNSN
jgi:hypothetical protein